jgi:hypothetical protein
MLVLDQVKEPLVATDEEAVIAKETAEKLRSVALAGVDVRLGVVRRRTSWCRYRPARSR